MSFRPQYGVPYNHYPQQPIVFGQMRMPGQIPPPREMPPAPVFVGNISEKCSDEFMKKMLEECGQVSSWKRIQGTNGKWQGFGFCNFSDAEGTLRALRILNDFHLGDKKLTVKAEEKVRIDLRKSAIETRKRQGKNDLKLKEDELPADEEDLKKDEEIRLKILHWIEHDHPELLTVAEDGEISDKEMKKEIGKDRSPDRNKKDRRRRSRSRSRSQRNKRRRSRSSSSSSDSRSSRSYSSGSSRSRSRTPAKKTTSKRRRERSGTRSSEDEEDAHYEKEERKEKDRKNFMQKEAKRLRLFLEDYEDDKDDQKYYKSSMLFKRKRDYELELQADQKDRLREQQEIEELKKQIMEENNGEDNIINVEEEAMKRHQQKEDEAMRKLRADSGSPNPHQPLGQNGDEEEEEEEEESSSSDGSDSGDDEKDKTEKKDVGEIEAEEINNGSLDIDTPEPPKPPGGWKALGSTEETNIIRPNKSPNGNQATSNSNSHPPSSAGVSLFQPIAQRLNGVFGNDDEDDDTNSKKKLKPLEITREERMQVMSAEEKKTLSRQIIKNLPTGREDLFATSIEWDFIDKSVMETRIKPWVTKKVQEFLGEEETQLVDFICEKIEARSSPEQILKDIAMIIDDDADQFVVKMWRLLVYEGRARKMGVQ
ncbi:unnamed protein product [Caenorhabditis angaria]|uniref:RNA-binding protein 25 n=1 Tax=Caenorhabditis angaria TaxID=860376 RepID=A0A9P1N6P9_9PELO|nr:unnamed protein product [Caenorhabditis angaria]